MRHGGSPKGARKSGGLDFEAVEATVEVQKERGKRGGLDVDAE